jgi:hypothetical protein
MYPSEYLLSLTKKQFEKLKKHEKWKMYNKNRLKKETEEQRRIRLQEKKKINSIYWKKRITTETKKQREQRLFKNIKSNKIYRAKKKQIAKINKIIKDFFNNYKFAPDNQNKESDTQSQSSQFPPDHKKSGFCYCRVCNKPGPSAKF